MDAPLLDDEWRLLVLLDRLRILDTVVVEQYGLGRLVVVGEIELRLPVCLDLALLGSEGLDLRNGRLDDLHMLDLVTKPVARLVVEQEVQVLRIVSQDRLNKHLGLLLDAGGRLLFGDLRLADRASAHWRQHLLLNLR